MQTRSDQSVPPRQSRFDNRQYREGNTGNYPHIRKYNSYSLVELLSNELLRLALPVLQRCIPRSNNGPHWHESVLHSLDPTNLPHLQDHSSWLASVLDYIKAFYCSMGESSSSEDAHFCDWFNKARRTISQREGNVRENSIQLSIQAKVLRFPVHLFPPPPPRWLKNHRGCLPCSQAANWLCPVRIFICGGLYYG